MSKSNETLAEKIVKQHGVTTKVAAGYIVRLDNTLAMSEYFDVKSKKAAEEKMVTRLSELLGSGDLVLSDNWEQHNLK